MFFLPTKDELTKARSLIGESKPNNLLNAVAGNPVASFRLNIGPLVALAKGIAKDSGVGAESIPAELESFSDLAFSVYGTGGKSAGLFPIPNLLIQLQSEGGSPLATVKDLISQGMAGFGMPRNWQSMNLPNGKSVEMLDTPFLQVYASNVGSQVMLSNSTEVLSASTEEKPDTFVAKLSPKGQQTLTTRESVVSGYVNFREYANLLESMSEQLAGFTGGAGNNEGLEMMLEQAEDMKKLPDMTLQLYSPSEDTARIEMFYEQG